MKKALVLALTVLMVLSLATAAFAVEVTYEGKVAVKWGNVEDPKPGEDDKQTGFAQDALEAKVTVDFTKDYGDGLTAGVKTKTEAHGDKNKFEFDGSGWIKLERDLFTAQASTGIDGGAGKEFGQFNIPSKPGVGLDLNLVDGLTVNTVLNNLRNAEDESSYNFVVKGEYAQDLFSVGGGYQSNYGESVKDEGFDLKQSAFGVYGTLKLIDGLTIDAEFGSRDLDTETEKNEYTAIMANAAYDLDALSAKAGFFMTEDGFGAIKSKDDLDNEDWRINEWLKSSEVSQWAIPDFELKGANKVAVLYADASYKITDELSVNGYLDYLVSAKDIDDKAIEEAKDTISYKVGAAYTLGDLTLEGWYKAWIGNEVGAKAKYVLAENVEASFTVTNGKTDKDNDNLKAATSYTAVISASF